MSRFFIRCRWGASVFLKDVGVCKFGAFIACSRSDLRRGNLLERDLSGVIPPRRLKPKRARIRPVFLDRDEFPTSRKLTGPICDALAKSASLVVIGTRAAVRSIWIEEEIRLFRKLHPEGPVIALLLDGEEGLPPILRKGAGIDPVIVNLRETGRHAAINAVAAACLSVDQGQWAERVKIRSRWRKGFAAVALAAVLISGGYGFQRIEQWRAERAALQAEERGFAAEAQAALDSGDEPAALLAIENALNVASGVQPEPESLLALSRAMLETRLLAEFPAPDTDISTLAVLPDNRLAAVEKDGRAFLIDAETGNFTMIYEPAGRTWSRISEDGQTLWTAHFDEQRQDENGEMYSPLLFEETDFATGETRLATAVRSVATTGGAAEISPDGSLFAVDLGPGSGEHTVIGVFRRQEQSLAGVLTMPSDRADLWFAGPEHLLIMIDPPSQYDHAPGLYLWRIGDESAKMLRAPGEALTCPDADWSGPAHPLLMLAPHRDETSLLLAGEGESCLLRWSLPSGEEKPVLKLKERVETGRVLAADGPYALFPEGGDARIFFANGELVGLPGCGHDFIRQTGEEGDLSGIFCSGPEGGALYFGKGRGLRWSHRLHQGGAIALALDGNDNRIVSTGTDARIRIWDAAPRAVRAEEPLTPATSNAIRIEAGPPAVIRRNSDGRDMCPGLLPEDMKFSAIAPGGGRVAIGTSDHLDVYDVKLCAPLLRLDMAMSEAPVFLSKDRLAVTVAGEALVIPLGVDIGAAEKMLSRRLESLEAGTRGRWSSGG